MPTLDDKKNKGKAMQGKDRRPKGERPRGFWATAIENAKTPLGFFVLVVVAIELMLTTALAAVDKAHALAVVYGMLFVVILAGVAVAFFAYTKPSALLGSTANRPHDEAVQSFATKISGHWWQWVTPKSPSALSWVDIWVDPVTGALKMHGTAYSDNGEAATEWDSVATCIVVTDNKVFYYWKGGLTEGKPLYEGFGEFRFRASLESGRGFFSDAKLTDEVESITITKKFNFRRATDDDVNEMDSEDPARVSKRVLERERQRP